MAFVVKKHLDLAFVGDGWANAFLDFSGLTFKEVREFSKIQVDEKNPDSEKNLDETLSLVEQHFIAGQAPDETGKLIPVEKNQLGDFPVDVLVRAVQLLVGVDENLLPTSKK